MAKIDSVFEAISNGFVSPTVVVGTSLVPDEQMDVLKIRRKKAGQTHYLLWYLQIGEVSGTPTVFWGAKISDVINKALEWRGIASKKTRGPRNKVA